MNKSNIYMYVNLTCMALIIFANLGNSVNLVLLGVQVGTLFMQIKEARKYR